MWHHTARRIFLLLARLAPALFAARILGELLRPGLWPTIALTLALVAATLFLLQRFLPRRALWAALPLYAYILYPRLSPGFALAVAAASLTVACLLDGERLRARLDVLSPRLIAAALFVISFALYAHTVAPGLLPADSGEFQVVAARLGVAHPPGFALYTLLGHLATLLPIGPGPAYRLNLLSALIAAAALSLTFLSAFRLTRSRLAGLIAAAALATATTFWSQATTVNVRILAAFFAALAIYLLLRSRQKLARREPFTARDLFLFFLTLSLGVTHHASLAFLFLMLALALPWLDPDLLRRPRRWLPPAAGLLLGLLPLLYFPLRALTAASSGAPVRGVTPALATLPGFLQHILALGFRGDLFAYTEPQQLWARLQVMGNVMTFQFHWLLLAGMLLGLVLLVLSDLPLALALGGGFALHTLITATYRAPQTVEYMLPAYVPAALLLACAPSLAVRAFPPRALRPANALLAAALLVAAVAQGLQRTPSFARLSHDQTARDYAATILEQAPPDSVVLAGWHWATPLWYLQEVEERRPDLTIHYVFPTAEPYAETWALRIAEYLDAGRPVVATHRDDAAYAALPPYEPLGDAFLFPQAPRTTLPAGFTTVAHTLGGHVEIAGYRLAPADLQPTHEATLTIAWRPLAADAPLEITLFAHLVAENDGLIVAQHDAPVQPMPTGLTLTRLRLTPRPGARPGAYRLYVGAYESGTGQPLSALDGAERTLLRSVSLRPMATPPYTAHALALAPSTDGRRLVGYDWDDTLAPHTRLYLHYRTDDGYVTEILDDPPPGSPLPIIYGPWGLARPIPHARQQYVPLGSGVVWSGASPFPTQNTAPGATLPLAQYFAAGRPLQQDLVVSVRLVGYEPGSNLWDWWHLHDTVPALGAIPTLKWIAGSTVRDPHFLTVSPNAPVGQTLGALVTLYDAFTQQPLPILDRRITEEYPGIPAGEGVTQN